MEAFLIDLNLLLEDSLANLNLRIALDFGSGFFFFHQRFSDNKQHPDMCDVPKQVFKEVTNT